MNVRLPDPIVAGDTLDFLASDPDHLASAGWVLSYRLVPRDAAVKVITFAATAEGGDHRVNEAPTATALWGASVYQWFAYVTKGTERYTIGRGTVGVRADPAKVGAGYDGRSHARKVLDAIEAVLERRATLDQEEYTINNRSLKRTPIADLLVLRDRYKAIVASEEAAEKVGDGVGDGRRVYVRFRRG